MTAPPPPAEIVALDGAAFAAVVSSPFAGDQLSLARGTAAAVVDIGDLDWLPEDLRALASAPCVVVGVLRRPPSAAGRRLADAVDVLLAAPDAAGTCPGAVCPAGGVAAGLERLDRSIRANPLASVTAALLLRSTLRRSVPDGLVAESTAYSMLQGGPEFARWRANQPSSPVVPDARPPLRLQRDGGLLHLTLERPHRHNAFNTAMREALVEALELAAADPTLSVVLDGEGPSFCSGGDLSEFGSRPDPVTAHMIRLTSSPARLLDGLTERTEARLHGACIGAGIELPSFASRVVAAAGTFFALPEVGLGLIPGAGGTVSLPRRIGPQRTAYLALSLERLDVATALAWGLVDAVE